MKNAYGNLLVLLLLAIVSLIPVPGWTQTSTFNWRTVVNNGFTVPNDSRKFNSYNQPSINIGELVVFRARSKGGASGEPAHGIFTRNMLQDGTDLVTIFDRTTPVPQPDNTGVTFTEPPSFPRIDMYSDTIASRANYPPAWQYQLPGGTDTRAGTTGIYTNAFGNLITGASNLGAVREFGFFAVPYTNGNAGPTKFDVFPGAPAVTDGGTVVFKGNYTVGSAGMTGVYYRDITKDEITLSNNSTMGGGSNSAVLIADSYTLIPGSNTSFGSTAPPSAVGRQAVFAGFDNEDRPTLGGIYLAPLNGPTPELKPLVKIGGQVPGEATGVVFNRLGEGVSFDGRFVAFWGAWGAAHRTLVLQCPNDGNKDRLAYCRTTYPSGFTTTVPINQGIFVHDTTTGTTYVVAKSPSRFTDFVYWNFSGLVPGTGQSDDAGEPARWRSATFVAVSGVVIDGQTTPKFRVAFKARTGKVSNGAYVNPVDGIYLRTSSDVGGKFATVVESGTDGTLIDPAAVYIDTETPGALPTHLPVTEMGLERDGFRGNNLVINVSMGTEEAGWAGIYLTQVPQ